MMISFTQISFLSVILLFCFMFGMFKIYQLRRELKQYQSGKFIVQGNFLSMRSRMSNLNAENQQLNEENQRIFSTKLRLERKVNAMNMRLTGIEKVLGVTTEVPFDEDPVTERRGE